jgi:hypothetical protein
MRFLRFQLKFRHALSHYQYSKICPNLPKTAKICLKTIISRNFEIPPKTKILIFSPKKDLPCVEGAPKHVHTVWIFNTRIFHVPSSMLKNGLCI